MPINDFNSLIPQANQNNGSFEEHQIKTLRKEREESIKVISNLLRIINDTGQMVPLTDWEIGTYSISLHYMRMVYLYTRTNYHCEHCYIEKFFAGNRRLFATFQGIAFTDDQSYEEHLGEDTGEPVPMIYADMFLEEHRDAKDELSFHKRYTTCVVCGKVDRCKFCHNVNRDDYEYGGKLSKRNMYDPRTLPGDADSFESFM